jgi:hypothetical protein
MELKVFDPTLNREVRIGSIVDGLFCKVVMPYNFVTTLRAYPLLEITFDALREHDISKILLWEEEAEKALYSRVSDWRIFGYIHYLEDREYRFLSIDHMVSKVSELI